MPAPNTEHLLDQAVYLAAAPQAGAPRQTDIRRAISSAYYAAFHAALSTVANQVVGINQQGTALYALVYRSVDHRSLRALCDDLVKLPLPAKYAAYFPGGVGQDLTDLASAVSDLHENRHAADYDPNAKFKLSDAKAAISNAKLAVERLKNLPPADLRTVAYLLAFPLRR